MARIEEYDVIPSDTIPREEIGNMAGERIIENGISYWVEGKFMTRTLL